ncbi:MAG: glycine--tRNA ligase [Candidatus Dojkabacteria bacterium]|nr:glycine--tRNA ligase [Candidatus Dojkabacteria bacterium]
MSKNKSEQIVQNSKPTTRNSKLESLDQFKSWAKENGFIYASSEIYGGFSAVYDYGHYGILLKNNIQKLWEKSMTQMRDDVYLLDSGIFMHPKTWQASGHAAGFADVLVEDKETHIRYRADHLVEEWFEKKGEKVDMDKKTPEELAEIIKENDIKSPEGNELTEPRSFNLMLKTNMGTTDNTLTDENVVYARAETCQGIYLEYKNYMDTIRLKLPFGIAQVGKAFRNEIVARQFVFRTREFEQMELQYFHKPENKDELFEMWKEERMKWHIEELGIDPEKLRFKKHEKLVFYASQAFDIEYDFNTLGGFKELEGIHDRGDYDLTQHAEFSGQKLDYFDQENNTRIVPHIMETSVGLNRILMMVLEDAWTEEEVKPAEGDKPAETRVVLKIKKELAPIKVAILPLSKKEPLQKLATELQAEIRNDFMTVYDETASIGKRYRRQDEIGTPYCITIDFDSLEDKAVTIRERDSMEQVRIKIDEVKAWLDSKF